MGGSGGRGFRAGSDAYRAREKVRQEMATDTRNGQINEMLEDLLADYNHRDAESIRAKLDEIEDVLADQGHSLDRLLFGGSVAKHTYIDGLSDVDSLIYLSGTQPGPPAQVLAEFARDLRGNLGNVADISTGSMAVTITYQDGTIVQLLPAVERNGRTQVPDPAGDGWKAIRPHKFTEKLTKINERQSYGVVPVIKLAKGVIEKFAEDKRLSGYHVEALAVDAFRDYKGPKDRASMLEHLLSRAARGVLRPTGDITGQTVHIDEHLGAARSPLRQSISQELAATLSRLQSAATPSQYLQVLE